MTLTVQYYKMRFNRDKCRIVLLGKKNQMLTYIWLVCAEQALQWDSVH